MNEYDSIADSNQSVQNVTFILQAIADGQTYRTDELMAVVYDELSRLAEQRMNEQGGGLAMRTSSLVHEVYLRLVGSVGPDGRPITWQSKGHFFAAAAEAMRRILVDRARRQNSQKRGGGWERVALSVAEGALAQSEPLDVLALNDALRQLEAHDDRMAAVVKLRFFAGLTIEEAGKVLDIDDRTVTRNWTAARAWLHRKLFGSPPASEESECDR